MVGAALRGSRVAGLGRCVAQEVAPGMFLFVVRALLVYIANMRTLLPRSTTEQIENKSRDEPCRPLLGSLMDSASLSKNFR